MILSGMTMKDALGLIDVIPDCKLKADDPVLFIHRRMSEGEIYFISNQSENTINITPEFRVSGKMPELWDATTGSIRDLPEYTAGEKTTTVPLKLEAFESAFIIFRKSIQKKDEKSSSVNFPELKAITEVTDPWIVTFDTASRGPRPASDF